MTKNEIEDIARCIQLFCLVRRRLRFSGNQTGVDVMTEYLNKVDEAKPGIILTAEQNLVGCGAGITDATVAEVLASAKSQLESIK